MKRYLNTPEEITAALKEGKVVLDRTGNKYKSINGFIVVSYISGGWGVDPFIGNHAGLYVDEPKPLKLEVGKFYKTRDGRKALVYGKYKETKDKLEAQIAESQKKLDEDLARLESADKETLEVPTEKPEAQQAPAAQPEVVQVTSAPSSFSSSILDDII